MCMKFGLVGWESASLASRIVPAGWFVGSGTGFLPKAPRPFQGSELALVFSSRKHLKNLGAIQN